MTRISLIVLLLLSGVGALGALFEVKTVFAGRVVEAGALVHTNATGQTFSVTRLSFLVCAEGEYAWVDLESGRTRFAASAEFIIGVPPLDNHASPGKFAATHPLNPNLNGLHWNWKGGYVFLALEGLWKETNGAMSGFSYHIANDENLMHVKLPRAESGALVFELDKIVPERFSETNTTTHSRTGDELATELRGRVEKAFRLERTILSEAKIEAHGKLLVAAGAKPYRLTIPDYVPRPALPVDNPLTEEGVALGRRLFNDANLSINEKQSCASCHQGNSAFIDAGKKVSAGAEGKSGDRNAMSLFNLAWKTSFFWDGRAATLREQALMPIQNPVEMHESLTNVVSKLKGIPAYAESFSDAFGSAEIDADRIARALEQFLLVQVSFDSKFDRAIRGQTELTDQERRGFELFQTEYDPRRGQFGADCFHCHGGALFQSQSFANNGLDLLFKDSGRGGVNGKPADVAKFSVPSLRNISKTAPYMHDGRFETLNEVIAHYVSGVKRTETLDPNLAKHPDGGAPLSRDDQQALVAFLKTL
jgi:cytochrome c peroxidase